MHRSTDHSGQNNWPHAACRGSRRQGRGRPVETGEDKDENKSCAARSFRSGGPDTDVHCKARVWSVGSCSCIGQWQCKDDPDRNMHVQMS
jgi:hypothetical protein